jgi:hypothetical protein
MVFNILHRSYLAAILFSISTSGVSNFSIAHFLFVYQSSVNFPQQFISGVQVIQCLTHQTDDSFRLITAQGKLPVDSIYMESDTIATPCRPSRQSVWIAEQCFKTSPYNLSGKVVS